MRPYSWATANPPVADPTAPITGWSRERLGALADHLLLSVRPYASEGHGRITLPGPEGGYGHAIDGLEGFTRTLLLAGFRLAGLGGQDPLNLAEFYAQGIIAGADQSRPDRWVRLKEHGQAKVEAASLALILDLTRPLIWDGLPERTKEQVVDYLADCVGDTDYPRNNWCWFRLTVQTFLKSVGGPWSLEDMQADLALHDTFVRPDGWMSDGDERSYDHYAGWALHLYPTLWARMQGADFLADERKEADRQRLAAFLPQLVGLVGGIPGAGRREAGAHPGDTAGAPLIQGRSLAYRFATAAPFWAGAIAEVDTVPLGVLRRAAVGNIDYFVRHGSPDENGLLTQGWHHEWLPMLQGYSGPSSPYWASKGLLGLALPPEHPVWTATEQPLPVEEGNLLDVVGAPGWIRSATADDGIVRIINHGTDHAHPGDQTGDSPLYARLGYSTATWPWTDENSWRNPAEGSVALVDERERVTHRSGWQAIPPRISAPEGQVPVGVAASLVEPHWIDMPVKQPLFASGWQGRPTSAGRQAVVSLVRGPWEVRLSRMIELAPGLEASDLRLRFSGWPTVAGDGLTSQLTALSGQGTPGHLTREQASPLGPGATVPTLTFSVQPGRWVAVLVTLTGAKVRLGPASLTMVGDDAVVTWPDGNTTCTPLPGEVQ